MAFAPAYPPLSGEPRSAAPLDIATTRLSGASGRRSAARIQWKACWVSTCLLRLNDSHDCSCTGPAASVAPALSTSSVGWCCSIRVRAVSASVASATTGTNMAPSSRRRSASASAVRATPTTRCPRSTSAAAIAAPKPRLAPVTTAVVTDCCDEFVINYLLPIQRRSQRETHRRRRHLGARCAWVIIPGLALRVGSFGWSGTRRLRPGLQCAAFMAT